MNVYHRIDNLAKKINDVRIMMTKSPSTTR
jgi:hypothetical protein